MAGITGLSAATTVSLIKERRVDGSRSIAFAEIDELMLPGLAGKNVLVLICCNDSGATLAYAIERLNGLSPRPLAIRTAALYSAPSPLFKPNYVSAIVGKDTTKTMSQILAGLPWVSGSWVHPFGKERDVTNTST